MRFLDAQAEEVGNEPAVTMDGGGSRTWEELRLRVLGVASGLRRAGLEPGDRCALLAGNCLPYLESVLGAVTAGVTVVPVNWHLARDEVEYILENSGSRLLLLDPAFEEVGRAAASGAGTK